MTVYQQGKQLNITPEQWKKIYTLLYLTTKDTYLRWLQYRILHIILPTNSYLVKIQVCESNKCVFFCKNDKETIDHLFWHCDVIQLFIEQLKPLMSNYIFHPTKHTLLGDIDDMERNLLPLEIKRCIHHCKRKLFLYQWVTL